MFRQKNNLLGLLLLAFLAGCAHVPDMRSVRHRQAMEWEAQGERAYLRGNPEQSQRYYEAALQVNASIENARGIASDTLSLAQIELGRGEYEQAGKRLQAILDDREHLFTSADMAGAAARLAQLALLQKRPERAVQLAQQAESLCGEASCSLVASILNLRAQAALALGNPDEAAGLAGKAADAADSLKQPLELANARRLQGQALLRRKSAVEAVLLFEQALSMDKQQGQAGKIAEDLHFLVEAKDMLGLHEEAESFRRREHAVRVARGEKEK